MAPRIIVAHGYNAAPHRHWFPWLVEQFDPGVVTVPALPNSTAPELEPWVDTLAAAIGGVDDETILIGHSLGAITTLRVLERMPRPWRLRGLILVAGFVSSLPNLPKLDEFTAPPVDLATLAAHIEHRSVIGSDNDTTVAPAFTAELARGLEAPLTIVSGGGHFVDRLGCHSIPELLPVVNRMLEASPPDTIETRR
ncbi:RBBP9/YdeN family alpha/beta hydrolase [Mycetocola zhadangensis]|uniref:Serine hydrolase family protein n=1 Tax=Mycetocola zhadangensis TaxID=1164595 RepID=A0A3L7J0G5_9MICO|nr:alpha/beta fold hydrolase [Mycetocola zhadangensis]RLQ83976.1 serine hydrolase family protein [Mycetocola zhadangensis]GGE97200.1 putative hydrolase YdeN [Mycetocola zhadangensis]